jgi:hypothetical protein
MSTMPFIPAPATGAAFIGREGLVRNLCARIAKGESLAVIGGPKLGEDLADSHRPKRTV